MSEVNNESLLSFAKDKDSLPLDELARKSNRLNDPFLKSFLRSNCFDVKDIACIFTSSTYNENNILQVNVFKNYLYGDKYFGEPPFNRYDAGVKNEVIKEITSRFYRKRRLIKVDPPRYAKIDNPYIRLSQNTDFTHEERYLTSIVELFREYKNVKRQERYQLINMSKYYLLTLDGWGEFELIHPEHEQSSEKEDTLLNILFAVRTVDNGYTCLKPNLYDTIAVPIFDRISGGCCYDPPMFTNNTLSINLDSIKDRSDNRIGYIPQLNMSVYVIGTHSHYTQVGIEEHIFDLLKQSHPCFTDYKKVYTQRIAKYQLDNTHPNSALSIVVNSPDNQHSMYYVAMQGNIVPIPVTCDPDNLNCLTITSSYLDKITQKIVPMTVYTSNDKDLVFSPVLKLDLKTNPDIVGTDTWIMGTDYIKVVEEYNAHREKLKLSQYTEETIKERIKEETKALNDKIRILKTELETKKAEMAKLEFEHKCLLENNDKSFYVVKKSYESKVMEDKKTISSLKLLIAIVGFMAPIAIALIKMNQNKDLSVSGLKLSINTNHNSILNQLFKGRLSMTKDLLLSRTLGL